MFKNFLTPAAVLIFLLAANINIFPIKGSGKIIKEERTLASFTGINLNCMGNIIIKEGKTGKITINADDNIIPLIKTEIIKDVLTVSLTKIVTEAGKLELEVAMENISELSVNGNGKIDVQKKIIQDSISFKVSGPGNIIADIETKIVNTVLMGSGSIDLSGKTLKTEADTGGSGVLNLLNLTSDEAVIFIGGSAVCKVFVNNKLDINLKGGKVQYKGNPKINLTAVLSGSLEAL